MDHGESRCDLAVVKAILIDQTDAAGLLLLTVPVLISGNGAASGWLMQRLSLQTLSLR